MYGPTEADSHVFLSARSYDQSRYDLKLWIGDLREGVAYLPH
jgi:hypothetical protein